MVDLDNWLSERYRVSIPIEAEAAEEEDLTDLDNDGAEGNRG